VSRDGKKWPVQRVAPEIGGETDVTECLLLKDD
jgi:hypothetical protein